MFLNCETQQGLITSTTYLEPLYRFFFINLITDYLILIAINCYSFFFLILLKMVITNKKKSYYWYHWENKLTTDLLLDAANPIFNVSTNMSILHLNRIILENRSISNHKKQTKCQNEWDLEVSTRTRLCSKVESSCQLFCN